MKRILLKHVGNIILSQRQKTPFVTMNRGSPRQLDHPEQLLKRHLELGRGCKFRASNVLFSTKKNILKQKLDKSQS